MKSQLQFSDFGLACILFPKAAQNLKISLKTLTFDKQGMAEDYLTVKAQIKNYTVCLSVIYLCREISKPKLFEWQSKQKRNSSQSVGLCLLLMGRNILRPLKSKTKVKSKQQQKSSKAFTETE